MLWNANRLLYIELFPIALEHDRFVFAGAMSICPGIWLYQLTDEGLALDLTVKGTKYYKAGVLN